MEASQRLWSVVLNWKNVDLTKLCVYALLETGYARSIIIVDNGSEDGSAEELRREFTTCTVIANTENLGFSRGCNVGIRHAIAQGAEFIALVNNDLLLRPDSYEPVLARFQTDVTVAAVTGKILMRDERRIWQAGGRIDHIRVMGVPRGYGELDATQFDIAGTTRWASGAMSVFRADRLVEVGLLPEEYFFGQEEWDISTNLLRSGYRIAYEPGYIGVHSSGASYSSHAVLNGYGGTRNRQLYAEKYLSPSHLHVWRLALWLHLWILLPCQLRLRARGRQCNRLNLVAMRLAWSRHEAREPVTLEELSALTLELGAPQTWAPVT